MKFSPVFSSTALGSFPNVEMNDLSTKILSSLDIPLWPQLPNRDFRESMYIQFCSPLPSIKIDNNTREAFFDTNVDLTPHLELFYERYLAEDLEYFKLSEEFAKGFYYFQKDYKEATKGEIETNTGGNENNIRKWVKGQVTGPISFGLTISDQDHKASLYNDLLIDCIVKNILMNCRWQIKELQKLCSSVMIFVDEPYMAAFGSAYVNINRNQVIRMLDEIFEAIHQEGSVAGVHCCANTDWSVLLETKVDILSIDASEYMENLFLFYEGLISFLGRGGVIAWGIVPNDIYIHEISSTDIVLKLIEGLEGLRRKVYSKGIEISMHDIACHSLISPVCGLGNSRVEVSEQALRMLPIISEELRDRVL